ncbi:hypothetical protein [Terrarubrum flagellatum]|uniref:hypothetical protein n=1 Tax=Terrirubrum flagellatum TaxID=2895980 RepID=UPI00314532F0
MGDTIPVPADVANGLAVNACFDHDKVDAYMWLAACNKALVKHTILRTTNASNAVLDAFFVAAAISSAPLGPLGPAAYYWLRGKLTDTKTVETDSRRELYQDAIADYARYHEMFVHFADRGQAALFAEEKRAQAWRDWQAVQEKFEEARRINDNVTAALSTAYDTTHRVKVLADVGMIVVGAIVPLGFVANSAAGLAYSIGCKLANTMSDVATSNIQTYVRSGDGVPADAAGVAFNGAQSVADAYGESLRQAEAKRFVAMCEKLAARKGDQLVAAFDRAMADPVQNAAVKAGFGLPKPDVARAARGAIEAEKTLAAAARNAAPRSGNAMESFAGAPTKLSKGLIASTRVASIAVGIYFMWDDIKIAWEGKTAYDERMRRGR